MTRELTEPTDAERISHALCVLRPLQAILPPQAQFVVAEAIAVLEVVERLLGPNDTQDTVTPRPQ